MGTTVSGVFLEDYWLLLSHIIWVDTLLLDEST